MDTSKAGGFLQGASKLSKVLDAYVLCHCACALSFATVMLLSPRLFAIFALQDLPGYALDSVRWASPFVYGFGILAGLSLTMPADARFKIACMYTTCLGLAVPVGCFVQATGRWNDMHPLMILVFAALSGGYAYFVVSCPEAFDRQHQAGRRVPSVMDMAKFGGLLQGASQQSKVLDAYVLCHCACALSFATIMLLSPGMFAIFALQDLPGYALDAVRWASPFVYGFGILAGLSLTMPVDARFKIACMYTACLGLAVPVGCFVQATGRWNDMHPLMILVFAALSSGYAHFVVRCPEAFDRQQQWSGRKSLLPK